MKLSLGVIYEPDFSYFDFEHDYRAWEPGSGPNRDADVELMVGNQDRRSGEIHLGPFGFYSHWSTSGQGSLGRRKDSAGYLFQVRFPNKWLSKECCTKTGKLEWTEKVDLWMLEDVKRVNWWLSPLVVSGSSRKWRGREGGEGGSCKPDQWCIPSLNIVINHWSLVC